SSDRSADQGGCSCVTFRGGYQRLGAFTGELGLDLTLQGASGLTLQGASRPRCKVLRDYAARRARRTQAARCLVTTLEGAARLCCRVLRDFAVEGLQASLKGRFATSLCRGLAGFAA